MKRLLLASQILIFGVAVASAQSNRIVFGPLVGDDAGVLTVHNGEAIGIEMWVRTDPDNPSGVVGMAHFLLSEDFIIADRHGMDIEYPYDSWWQVWVDGPFVHDPDDAYPIPEGWTCEIQAAFGCVDFRPDDCDSLNTQGEWDLYGTWLMVINTGIPRGETYYPFDTGWYPHSGQGTSWSFNAPPGGHIIPEQDYCGLYFEPDTCIYIPGDVNRNGASLELADVLAMIASYRGIVEPYYLCQCSEDPPIFDFAATADPNGNCIPNELNDVVTEIGAYRGSDTVSGCPDCPGSGPLLIGQNKDR